MDNGFLEPCDGLRVLGMYAGRLRGVVELSGA